MFLSTISFSFWNYFNHFATSENTNLVLIRLRLGDGLAIVRIPLGWAVGEALALAILHHVHALPAICYILILFFFISPRITVLYHVHALWTFWGSFHVFSAYLIFFIGISFIGHFSIPPPALGILWTCWTLWSLGNNNHAFEQNTRRCGFGCWQRQILVWLLTNTKTKQIQR